MIHPYPLSASGFKDPDDEDDLADDLADDDDCDSQISSSSALTDGILAGYDDQVPIDKENPRRCAACGKIFQNHFGVKTHYQNVSHFISIYKSY